MADSTVDLADLANKAYSDLGVEEDATSGWTEVKYSTGNNATYLKNVNSILKKGQDGKFQDGKVIFKLTLNENTVGFVGEVADDSDEFKNATEATGVKKTGKSSPNAGLVKSDGTALDAITSSNLSSIYGTAVKYGTEGSEAAKLTWRVFYVDYDGRYGDKNTVYLKSDPISLGHDLQTKTENPNNEEDYAETDIITDSDVNSATGNKIWQMNPAYATACSNTFQSGNTNAQSVAYLMDPTKWTEYLDTMYCKGSIWWWLGSPSSSKMAYGTLVYSVDGYSGYFSGDSLNISNSVCLLASLKTKVQ